MALTLYQQQRKLAFEVLGVPLDSPEKRIRRAYRERVVMVHRSHLLLAELARQREVLVSKASEVKWTLLVIFFAVVIAITLRVL